MTRSGLIEKLAAQQLSLPRRIVEEVVKEILEHLADTLVSGERIEIRGFGTLSLRYRAPGTGRNPKTGELVELASRCVPHFKPGGELKARVNHNPDRNHSHGECNGNKEDST